MWHMRAGKQMHVSSMHMARVIIFNCAELTPSAVLAWFGMSLLKRHVTRIYWLPSCGQGAFIDSSSLEVPSTAAPADSELPQAPVSSGFSPHSLHQLRGDHQTRASASGHPQDRSISDLTRLESGRDLAPEHQALSSSSSTIGDRQELLEDIVSSDAGRCLQQPGVTLRLQCCPRDLERFLQVCVRVYSGETRHILMAIGLECFRFSQENLPESFDLQPRNFTHVLMVVEGECSSNDGIPANSAARAEGKPTPAEIWLRWSAVPAAFLYRQPQDEVKTLPGAVAHVRPKKPNPDMNNSF